MFQARRQKRPDLAEEWLTAIPATASAAWLRSRAEAAVLEAQGDIEGSLRKLNDYETAIRALSDVSHASGSCTDCNAGGPSCEKQPPSRDQSTTQFFFFVQWLWTSDGNPADTIGLQHAWMVVWFRTFILGCLMGLRTTAVLTRFARSFTESNRHDYLSTRGSHRGSSVAARPDEDW